MMGRLFNVVGFNYVLLLLLIEARSEYFINVLLSAKNSLEIVDHVHDHCHAFIHICEIFDTSLFGPHQARRETNSNILQRHFIFMRSWNYLPD